MARQNVPGTVWKSHGSWHWRVKFPDERQRRDVVLTFPFSGKRIPSDCAQSVAESAAFRLLHLSSPTHPPSLLVV